MPFEFLLAISARKEAAFIDAGFQLDQVRALEFGLCKNHRGKREAVNSELLVIIAVSSKR